MTEATIEAILLGLTLIKMVTDDLDLARKGELDPEQLAAEWKSTVGAYTEASDGWRAARNAAKPR